MRYGRIMAGAARWGLAALIFSLSCLSPALAQDAAAIAQPVAHSEDDLRCLTLAVAYEAANQPVEGQEAVAEVVLNRTRHPSFPRSVCGVVFQGWTRHTGCQFTFTCDGAIDRRLPARILTAARAVAERVAGGEGTARVAGALNYHANYVSPAWAGRLDRVAKIGAHIFYRPEPGGLPENGRAALVSASDGDSEGAQAIRRYAAYFAVAPSDGLPSGYGGTKIDESRPDVQKPFAPWGLSLR